MSIGIMHSGIATKNNENDCSEKKKKCSKKKIFHSRSHIYFIRQQPEHTF